MLTIGLLTICFLVITITLVFDTFKDNLSAINHELNLSSSLETVLHISEILYLCTISLCHQQILCISSKTKLYACHLYTINKIVPNIEP